MKSIHKRILIIAATLALAVGLQWLSAIPFQRSPGEAYAALCIIVLASWLAAYPGFKE